MIYESKVCDVISPCKREGTALHHFNPKGPRRLANRAKTPKGPKVRKRHHASWGSVAMRMLLFFTCLPWLAASLGIMQFLSLLWAIGGNVLSLGRSIHRRGGMQWRTYAWLALALYATWWYGSPDGSLYSPQGYLPLFSPESTTALAEVGLTTFSTWIPPEACTQEFAATHALSSSDYMTYGAMSLGCFTSTKIWNNPAHDRPHVQLKCMPRLSSMQLAAAPHP